MPKTLLDVDLNNGRFFYGKSIIYGTSVSGRA